MRRLRKPAERTRVVRWVPDPLPPAGQRTSLSHMPWVEFPGVVGFAFPRDLVVVNFKLGRLSKLHCYFCSLRFLAVVGIEVALAQSN